MGGLVAGLFMGIFKSLWTMIFGSREEKLEHQVVKETEDKIEAQMESQQYKTEMEIEKMEAKEKEKLEGMSYEEKLKYLANKAGRSK